MDVCVKRKLPKPFSSSYCKTQHFVTTTGQTATHFFVLAKIAASYAAIVLMNNDLTKGKIASNQVIFSVFRDILLVFS